MKYTIYKHTNNITGKSYIGQTKFTMEQRLKHHLIDAKQGAKRNKTRPFHSALLKYSKEHWTSHVLEVTTKELSSDREKYWINYFNTYTKGYNATMGGDYLEGYKPLKGDLNPNTDTAIYKFYHRYFSMFQGTIREFSAKTGMKVATARSLAKRKGTLSINGWVIDPMHLYLRPGLKLISAPKVVIYSKSIKQTKKVCPICNIKVIDAKCKTCIACRCTKGCLNGMYGRSRTEKDKLAVSRRMYLSADSTLRKWVHPVYGVEENIKTIDLRNKYKELNLSISALKKVTDKAVTQHKEWRLSET